MKKLTLNQAWTQCLRMWKWIDKQFEESSGVTVSALKCRWLKENGYADECIVNDCFFCDYDVENGNGLCSLCPGELVNKRFNCENVTYDWYSKPRKFYKKLLELNKKRKAKK